MPEAGSSSEWLTTEEAAALLKVNPVTILRWCKQGEIRHTRVGRTYRIRRADLEGHANGRPAGLRTEVGARRPTAHIAAIANLKGGIGKTTSVYALADVMANRGLGVLMVDMDPQGSLSVAAGVRLSQLDERSRTIGLALDHYSRHLRPLALDEYRHRLDERLHLLPATLQMHLQENELRSAARYEFLLQETLAPALGEYDVILIDCAPSASAFTTMALTAAESVIVPVTPEYLSAEGLALLFHVIDRIRATKLNPDLAVDGMILTMLDRRTMHAREMVQIISDFLGTLQTPPPILGEVRRAVAVVDASAMHQPVTRYAPESDLARAYEQIADRLLLAWGVAVPAVRQPALA